jgi:hypothetical protein
MTEDKSQDQIDMEGVVSFIRDHLKVRDYQFVLFVLGKRGQAFSCEINQWGMMELIRHIVHDKQFKLNFWKKLFILFG